jgi:putative endonuclease
MKSANNGALAEQLAADFLSAQGLEIVDRNYRCRMGEVDLILRDRGVLVFAEVRLRRRADFGGAAGSITAAKQSRIVAAARHYLAGKPERACRFDAVLLDRLAPDAIEWIQDAFGE